MLSVMLEVWIVPSHFLENSK
ncbi:hypothetical protein XFF6992_710021 [Xanthomonas citri pv. fuscans]|nr:hypothetical protein XFF6992_190101 [Xanthomonas citri pv. fuscans]SOO21706.1 hypothetical protein XFF6992_710021 [Xanthomonas citri pv. fuscans]SOO30676.1 hypothetical protein XFF6994_1130004 [Xanthomonas citri pv. fuscans]